MKNIVFILSKELAKDVISENLEKETFVNFSEKTIRMMLRMDIEPKDKTINSIHGGIKAIKKKREKCFQKKVLRATT